MITKAHIQHVAAQQPAITVTRPAHAAYCCTGLVITRAGVQHNALVQITTDWSKSRPVLPNCDRPRTDWVKSRPALQPLSKMSNFFSVFHNFFTLGLAGGFPREIQSRSRFDPIRPGSIICCKRLAFCSDPTLCCASRYIACTILWTEKNFASKIVMHPSCSSIWLPPHHPNLILKARDRPYKSCPFQEITLQVKTFLIAILRLGVRGGMGRMRYC